MLSVFRTLQNVYFTAYLFCRSLQSFYFLSVFAQMLSWNEFLLCPVVWKHGAWQEERRAQVQMGMDFSHCFTRLFDTCSSDGWTDFPLLNPKMGCEEAGNVILQLCEPNEQLLHYPYITQPYSKIRNCLLSYPLHGSVLKKLKTV